jgi:dihydroorotase
MTDRRLRTNPSDLLVGRRLDRLEISRARVVDPATGFDGHADLVVRDGRIAAIGEPLGVAPEDPGTGSGAGILVVPGFIDLHAHLREPGDHLGETIATGLAAAAHGGFTTVLAMANTTPATDRPEHVTRALASAAASGSPVRYLAAAATTVGRAGHDLAPLRALVAAGASAVSDDGSPVADAQLLRAALTEAGLAGSIVIEHPEDPALAEGGVAHDGLVATILGLPGWPEAAESAAVARAIAVLRQVVSEAPPGCQPRLHLTHLSTGAAVRSVRAAKQEGLPVTCDVTPHHLALHDGWVGGDRRYAWDAVADPWTGDGPVEGDAYDSSTRVNPPLRPPRDALALAEGIEDGTIDAIATDHAPHTGADKDVEFAAAAPGISGIETAFGLVLAAVDAGVLSLGAAVAALTTGPARVLGLEAPSLAVGAAADLVVIDSGSTWTVDARGLRSRGFNTPLLGRPLRGRTLLTVAHGSVAHVAAELAPAR